MYYYILEGHLVLLDVYFFSKKLFLFAKRDHLDDKTVINSAHSVIRKFDKNYSD